MREARPGESTAWRRNRRSRATTVIIEVGDWKFHSWSASSTTSYEKPLLCRTRIVVREPLHIPPRWHLHDIGPWQRDTRRRGISIAAQGCILLCLSIIERLYSIADLNVNGMPFSISNDICTTFRSHPDFVYSSRIYIDPISNVVCCLHRILLFWVYNNQLAFED